MSRLRAIPPKRSIPRNKVSRRASSPPPLKIEPNKRKERATTFRILKEITNEMEEIESAIGQGIPHNEKYLGILRTRVQTLRNELNIERKQK